MHHIAFTGMIVNVSDTVVSRKS